MSDAPEPIASPKPRPQPPPEPDPADCCGEGCVNCIYDVYEAALERYHARLAAWEAAHQSTSDGPPTR